MPLWLQHTLVLALVGGCLAYALWQIVRTFAGKRSRLGSCCAKGCEAQKAAAPNTDKIHFFPAEMLGKKRT